jgi:hypothetical protein
MLMSVPTLELLGTVRPDGTLELDQKLTVPPGRVKVRVESTDVTRVPDAEERFRDLVRQWKEEALTSSVSEMATHPAYQQIIGMGKEVLPLLLEELRREPDHWFWALKSITGEDPVPPADRGKLQAMTQAWLDWAEGHGY